jgi:hypothetical protein
MKIRREEAPNQLAERVKELCEWNVVQNAYKATLKHAEAASDGKTGYLPGQEPEEGWQTSIHTVLPNSPRQSNTNTLRLENNSQTMLFKARAVIAQEGDEYERSSVVNTFKDYDDKLYTFISGKWVRGPINVRQRNAGVIAVYGGALGPSSSYEPELIRFESFSELDIKDGSKLLSEVAGSLLELAGVQRVTGNG